MLDVARAKLHAAPEKIDTVFTMQRSFTGNSGNRRQAPMRSSIKNFALARRPIKRARQGQQGRHGDAARQCRRQTDAASTRVLRARRVRRKNAIDGILVSRHPGTLVRIRGGAQRYRVLCRDVTIFLFAATKLAYMSVSIRIGRRNESFI
ncbi:MAG: hypothetical protein H7335_17560 [Massilia sp.]|nr:hypothetical protein [Massilia sp.]